MPQREYTDAFMATDQRDSEQVSASELSRLMRMVDGIHGIPASVRVRLTANGIQLEIDNWPLRNAWVAGIEFVGLDSDPTKPYVWCDASVPTAYESESGYGTDELGRRKCPANVEIYEKSELYLMGAPRVPRI
jgi:hypothetical protein